MTKFLAFLQKIVAADKAPLVAAALAGLSLLAVKFGLHLNSSVTAYLGVLLMGLAGAFTHAHFASHSVRLVRPNPFAEPVKEAPKP